MTTFTLRLSPVSAKYLRYYHDSPTGKPVPIARQFMHLIKLLVEPHSNGVSPSCEPGQEEIKLEVGDFYTRFKFDARCAIHIPPHKMEMLDVTLTRLFEFEINVTVDAYLSAGKMQKDAILSVFDKYDIDGDLDYSYDRAHKMNQRYRNRQSLTA